MSINAVNTHQNVNDVKAPVEVQKSNRNILRVILDQFSFFFSKTCSGFKWAVSTIFDNRVVEKIKQLNLFGTNKIKVEHPTSIVLPAASLTVLEPRVRGHHDTTEVEPIHSSVEDGDDDMPPLELSVVLKARDATRLYSQIENLQEQIANKVGQVPTEIRRGTLDCLRMAELCQQIADNCKNLFEAGDIELYEDGICEIDLNLNIMNLNKIALEQNLSDLS